MKKRDKLSISFRQESVNVLVEDPDPNLTYYQITNTWVNSGEVKVGKMFKGAYDDERFRTDNLRSLADQLLNL